MSQITFFGNNYSVDAFNAKFNEWQEEYHLVLKRHELTPVCVEQASLNAVLRWYSRWIDSMFTYKGGHIIAKNVIKLKGKFVCSKGYNLSRAMSRGLMGYKSPNWKTMILVNETNSFNGKSYEDLPSLVYMQMCWYLRSVVLNHQDELNALYYEAQQLDESGSPIGFDEYNPSIFDIGNLFSFIRRSKYYKIVGFFGNKKEELELETSYDISIGDDESTSILDLIADESTRKSESEPSTILAFYKRVFNILWREKVYSKKDKSVLKWAEHPASKFAWQSYFVQWALEYGEETPIAFDKTFWENKIISIHKDYWQTMIPEVAAKRLRLILDMIRSLSKEGLLQIYRGAENVSKPSKARGKGSSQNHADRAKGKEKVDSLTPNQKAQVAKALKEKSKLSENFGKIEIRTLTKIKIVTIEDKLYTISFDEQGNAFYKLNLELEGMQYLGHSKTGIEYEVQLGTIEREYISLEEYRKRYPKQEEQKEKTVIQKPTAPYYPRCELPVSQVLECKPYLNPTCIGGDQLNLYSGKEQTVTYMVNEYLPNSKGELEKNAVGYETKSFIRNAPEPVRVKIRKDDIQVFESICKKDADTGLTNYLYKGDWLDDLEPEDIDVWYGFVPYWYGYGVDYTLNIPNVVGVELEDTVGYALVAPLESILHSFSYDYQNKKNDEGTAMFYEVIKEVSHNSKLSMLETTAPRTTHDDSQPPYKMKSFYENLYLNDKQWTLYLAIEKLESYLKSKKRK